jgi:hypothetical protein
MLLSLNNQQETKDAFMNTLCHKQLTFESLLGKKIVADFEGGQITSDAGCLLLREIDKQHGITENLANILHDPRRPDRILHDNRSMLQQRLYSIALGYEDNNDAAFLRKDPAVKIATDKLPEPSSDLASQPTLSRLENRATRKDIHQLSEQLFNLYLHAHPGPRDVVIIDMDSTDDPTHGAQQLSLFHGYFGQHMYHPLLIFDGITGFPMAAILRPGNCHASYGAKAVLKRLIRKLKQAYPGSTILLRADGGFAIPDIYTLCEKESISYTIGLITNDRLKARTDDLLAQAIKQFEEIGEKQRLFTSFYYRADSWHRRRRVIAKTECMPEGTNRRFVVTNLPGTAQESYDDIYVHRGDMENRIKELKRHLKADRLSCTNFLANQFRLLLHTFSYCFIWFLRESLRGTELACAQADTLRIKLLKIGARIVQSSRRVWIHMASGYPYKELFTFVLNKIRLTPG